MMIDSHAHITGDPVYEDVEAVLERAKNAQISDIINICTDPLYLERGIALSKLYSSKGPLIHNAAATHPHDAEKEGKEQYPIIERYAKENKLIAIGETGLDYHYDHSARDQQKEYLKKYLKLALDCKLPVVIHCREAFDDFFSILDSCYVTDKAQGKGVLHCFTGTMEEAKQVLKRGFYISFSGIITFKKSEDLREVVKMAPLDKMLIETDAPFLSPQSKRGKPNEPAFIRETAEMIAKIKEVDLQEIIDATTHNSKTLFNL
jgi:TatD DNase family protein